MKKTSLKKLLALTMACILLLGAAFSTTVTAEETPATVSLINIELDAYMHIACAIANNLGEGTTGLYVYSYVTDEQTSIEAEPIYTTFTLKTSKGGVEYHATQSISAKDIETKYVIVPVVKLTEDDVRMGTPLTYSVAAYCADRADDKGVTAAQQNLYNKIIEYGKAAGAVLNK